MPVFGMTTTVVLFATTYNKDPENWLTKFTKVINPKTSLPIIQTKRFSKTCAECAKLNANGMRVTCQHKAAVALPPWKSQRKAEIMQILTEQFGTKGEMINRVENEGGDPQAEGQLFNQELCRNFFESPPVHYTQRPNSTSLADNPPTVYVCIDPEGAGRSETAIVSVFVKVGMAENPRTKKTEYVKQIIIVGVEIVKLSYNQSDHHEFIFNHIKKIKSNSFFTSSSIILIPENNTHYCAINLFAYIEYMKNSRELPLNDIFIARSINFYTQSKTDKPNIADPKSIGVRKTQSLTIDYLKTFASVLEQQNVLCLCDFIVCNTIEKQQELLVVGNNNYDIFKKLVWEKLLSQLLNLRTVQKRGTQSQKITGKDTDQEDDGAVAMLMAVYFAQTETRYIDNQVFELNNR